MRALGWPLSLSHILYCFYYISSFSWDGILCINPARLWIPYCLTYDTLLSCPYLVNVINIPFFFLKILKLCSFNVFLYLVHSQLIIYISSGKKCRKAYSQTSCLLTLHLHCYRLWSKKYNIAWLITDVNSISPRTTICVCVNEGFWQSLTDPVYTL